LKITPLDVRKHQFRKILRGYDPEEVGVFLDLVANQMESVLKESSELKEKVTVLETRLADYEKMETTLRDTLLSAERAAAQSRETAEREAKMILKEAEHQAEKIAHDSTERLAKIRAQILELAAARESFAGKFRALLDAQRKVLDMYDEDLSQDLPESLRSSEGSSRGVVPGASRATRSA